MAETREEAAAAGEQPAAVSQNIAALVPLLWEINNLKRVKSADTNGDSVAASLFRRAWINLNGCSSALLHDIAVKTAADAVVAAQLGAINRETLIDAGLSEDETKTILLRAFDLSANPIEENLRAKLRAAAHTVQESFNEIPGFVERLQRQPRSGATKPGALRLVFDSPENHAEHSVAVAIFGVLLAPVFGAKAETVFLAGLAHHFHNAYLPDSGFAGEELLGEFLPEIFDNLRERCLRQLSENLRPPIQRIFVDIAAAGTPEARAFHAADVLDRVLQMRHHTEANEFTLRYALEEMELVHAGAVQSFHYDVLRAAKLV